MITFFTKFTSIIHQVHELIPPQDVLSEEIKQWAILEEAEGLLHLQEKLGKQIGSEANTWHL